MTQAALWMLRYAARTSRENLMLLPKTIANWRNFWGSYRRYRQMEESVSIRNLYPCIGDNTTITEIEPTYFYQDAWAFEKIVQLRPPFHVDVGSHHKFVALLSKVTPVTMVDIRPLSLPLNTLRFQRGSILELPFRNAELPSLSSLCVVEHIGLGRYGDPLDPLGSEKAIAELKRVIAPGGRLFLSVPVGDKNIVAFNAGRVFSLEYLCQLFQPFEIVEQRFIVGMSFQDTYMPQPGFGTTGLFELMHRS